MYMNGCRFVFPPAGRARTIAIVSIVFLISVAAVAQGMVEPAQREEAQAAQQQAESSFVASDETPTLRAPIHIIRLRDANTPVATPTFAIAGAFATYFGGPIISKVHIVQVLYGTGSYLPGVQATTTPSVASFFADITQSSFFDMLGEYSTAGVTAADGSAGTNQTLGHGFFDGQFTITPSAANNGTIISDTQIQAELLAQVAAGHLPAPVIDAQGNNSTLYMLYFPAGKSIRLGTTPSCQSGGFCAYHNSTTTLFGGRNLYYGVMPDTQPPSLCSVGCGAGGPLDVVTNVTSHELAEAVTDANVGPANVFGPPLAWLDPINGEIADICETKEASILVNGTTYTVQQVFSNIQDDCAAGPVQFPMTAGPNVAAGAEFDIDLTVTNNPATTPLFGYTGTVHFSSSDPAAVLPPDYKFTFADAGHHNFLATLKTGGSQTITAADAAITGSGTTIKLGVNVPNVSQFTVAAPGAVTTGVPVTVVVTAQDPTAVVQTSYNGKVHFTSTDAGAVLPPDTNLVNGTGTFTVTFNNAGNRSLQVLDALTPALSKTVLVTVVGPAANATTTTLTADATSVPYGQSIQLTMNVTASSPITQPGSMSITMDGGAFVGGGIIDSTLALFGGNGGTHTLYANYFGNGVQAPSSSAPLTITVTPVASTTVLSSDLPSAPFGTVVRLHAQVLPSPTINPRGSMTFFDGANPIAIIPATNSTAPGFTFSTLPVGSHTLTASFSGSPDLLPSTSAPITQFITAPPPPDYGVFSNPQSATIHAGQAAGFSITTTSVNGFTGEVHFSCGALPALTTCTFLPAKATVKSALSTVVTTLIIKTSGPNAHLLAPDSLRPYHGLNAKAWGAVLFAVGVVLLGVGPRRRRRVMALSLFAVLLAALIISCGGGGSQPPPPPPPTPTPTPTPATPAGTSTITISASGTATAGPNPANPNQQVQLTITVLP
jgi:Big-like domain-containing protein